MCRRIIDTSVSFSDLLTSSRSSSRALSLIIMHSKPSMLSRPTVALIDADNTLWDTDAVFRTAQLRLLSLVESNLGKRFAAENRLDFVRAYDQALALAHHLHLRYPPQLLVRALEAGLAHQPADRVARDLVAGRMSIGGRLSDEAVQALATSFLEALNDPPPLLPTVREAVVVARLAGFTLYVMTEGRVARQKKLLDLYELTNFFEDVWELTKTEEQFGRLMTRFSGSRVIVVGDQPDRDIFPSKAAGCVSVFVPSRFTPSWNATASPLSADYVASDLLGAITWCVETHADQ